jgi:gliding motility-associated-like protein
MSSFYQNKKLNWLLSMLFLFAFNMVSGQGFYNTANWKFSNPKQFGFTILDLDYFDNNNVLAVGSDGGIAKSTDGGTNWTYGPFTYTNPLGQVTKSTFNDVHYVTSTVAYAVGDRGNMAKTIDGGVTWSFIATPLFINSRNMNACWFLDANRGYIGGQWNTPDSTPKLYFTLNGGTTWDSIAAPAANGTTKVGFINNVSFPSINFPITAKAKDIHRIEFINNIGYISGGGAQDFPSLGIPNITNSTTCALTGSQTTGSHNASLLWKFENGALTDYSISKERLGYTGFPATLNCTSKFGTVTQCVQQYRAINIVNDSLLVMMSFNNNVVIRVSTGKNDSTQNVNRPGVFEKGKFEILSTGPSGPPPGFPPIPAVQTLFASNPYHMLRNTAGTLVTGSFSNNFGPGFLWTSTDTGRTWAQRSVYPQGRNWSPVAAAPALDFAPNGKLLVMGNNGIVGDSSTGTPWNSNYVTTPLGASYNDMEFADCNNGIAAGGSSITVTTDGGQTWIDRANGALAGLFANITSVTYPQVNKAYFTTNIGTIYRSTNQGANLVPVFIDNYGGTSVINDLAAVGTDSLWACGVQQTSVPALQRFGLVYRSFNNGASWDTIKVGPLGNVGTQAQQFVTFRGIEFPSRTVGYASGNRGAVYKTIDAGATWTNISPFPALNISPAGFANSAVSYTDILALDNNTVFVVGNMFTSANNRRIYKTTDGGATWADISGNIGALSPGGNLNGILMHDANNGYVVTPGGVLFTTTNGGTSWTLDLAPTGSIFTTMSFAPKKVPAGITMQNRKMFVCGVNINGAPMMEYGSPANINVNATETITNANCTNLAGGSITINATGAIAPYTYSINGGPFQASNTFTGLTQGPKTITIKDSYCGILTKTVTVGFTDNLTLTTNNDTLVCAGAPVQMIATSAANTYSWAPATGLSNPNISNPVATINSAVTYTVTASLNGCVKTRNVTVGIKPNPQINAGPDKTIVSGDAVTLDGSIPAGITAQSISWAPATNLTGANTLTPVARPVVTTTYTVTVLDNNNCTATDAAIITVIPYCVKVMDAFSPNGDAKNDRWLVTNGAPCAGQISVAVYNRYGGLVYKNQNYQNNWDGTYEGKPVADGTYYYNITYRLINGNPVQMKGDVTILR